MKINFRLLRNPALWLTAVALTLTGCAQIPLPSPSAKPAVVEKARVAGLGPVNIGTFKADPKLGAERDRGINVRSNTISSPIESSFAQYLRETIMVDAKAAGLYDPSSSAVLNGFLTDSSLDVAIDIGRANLAARFVLTNGGNTVYDKELKAQANWPSSFVGAIAIPEGMIQYADLYHKLVDQLFSDPDYRKATQK